jgi:hypothetical protein
VLCGYDTWLSTLNLISPIVGSWPFSPIRFQAHIDVKINPQFEGEEWHVWDKQYWPEGGMGLMVAL